jgi:hypothetical protein
MDTPHDTAHSDDLDFRNATRPIIGLIRLGQFRHENFRNSTSVTVSQIINLSDGSNTRTPEIWQDVTVSETTSQLLGQNRITSCWMVIPTTSILIRSSVPPNQGVRLQQTRWISFCVQ